MSPIALIFLIISSCSAGIFEWSDNTCKMDIVAEHLHATCVLYDTLDRVPIFPPYISQNITKLVIKNQPKFQRLARVDLANFPNLVELTIAQTGLKWLDQSSLNANPKLEMMSLASNKLETLDWRWFMNLTNFKSAIKLDISDNPLVCNCSIYWLNAWRSELVKKRRFSIGSGLKIDISMADIVKLPKEILNLDGLECNWKGQKVNLQAWPYLEPLNRTRGCSLPSVEITPKFNRVSEGDSSEVKFNCAIQSDLKLDTEFRLPFGLTVINPETKQLLKWEKKGSEKHQMVTLRLGSVNQGQMGWYFCLGYSDAGPNFDVGVLVVDSKPTIHLLKKWSNKLQHHEENFALDIYSFPPPTNWTWLKDNVPIDMNATGNTLTFRVIDHDTFSPKTGRDFYKYAIDFTIMFVYDNIFYEGNYSVIACNSMGCTRLDFVNYTNNSLPEEGPERSIGPKPTGQMSTTGNPASVANGLDLGWIVAVGCMSIGLIMCAIGAVLHYVRKKYRNPDRPWFLGHSTNKTRKLMKGLEPSAFPLRSYETNDVYEPLLTTSVPMVPKHSLQIVRSLGEGAFGEVYLAYCNLNAFSSSKHQQEETSDSQSTSSIKPISEQRSLVAAKALKQFTLDRSKEIAREAELMAKLNHPNIVTFYGVCLRGDSDLLLLYEYMELGDLRQFLSSHGPDPELSRDKNSTDEYWLLTHAQLIDIAKQVANGLAYLHNNHFVHRDLASRNCLVKSPLIVKLSDFGMTRDIYSSDYYRLTHQAPLPVRWLPPESLLYGRFSDLSDIWSFGIVVWEIVSYGKLPWCEYSNFEVMQRASAGETLNPPTGCPEVLRTVMLDCWKRIPNERAKLSDIINRLGTALRGM